MARRFVKSASACVSSGPPPERMNRNARREAIERLLWPQQRGSSPLGVWALLDLARDPRIHAALIESRLEYLCLYEGRQAPVLEQAAPHMVELLPGHRLTARLLEEGWGDSWGVFLTVGDASNLRRHLRRFLKVRDEAGRSLLFRYYDPRVLRIYLPTCTPVELDVVFGPLATWVVEGEGGAGVIEFRRAPTGGLRVQETALT